MLFILPGILCHVNNLPLRSQFKYQLPKEAAPTFQTVLSSSCSFSPVFTAIIAVWFTDSYVILSSVS
jgi:hypothetical protein